MMSTDREEASNADSESSESGLRLGDRGEHVRGVYRYLADYGYFPNTELAVRYPGFEPLVAAAPEKEDVFDEQLELGVRLFQRYHGLPASGVVDDDTRAAMTRDRCSYPDGYAAGHSHVDEDGFVDKFAANANPTFPDPTWSLESFPTALGEAAFVQLIEQMLNQWRSVHPSAIPRVPVNNTEPRRIRIRFEPIDGPRMGGSSCTSGCVAGVWNPAFRTLSIDSAENWAFNSNPTSTQADFRTILLHELGHALSLDHSSHAGAVMTTSVSRGTMRRTLSLDDTMAIRSAFNEWGNVDTPTAATFGLGIGPNNHMWILSNEASPGGLKIYRWNGSAWINVPGGAVTITADARGRAWAVNTANEVFFTFSDFSGWRKLDQVCARNIDAAASGKVWIIGCDGHMWESPYDSGATDSQIISQLHIGWRQWPMPNGRMPRAFANTSLTGTNGTPTFVSTTSNEFWALILGSWNQISYPGPINILDIGSGPNSMAMWAIESGTNKVFASNRQVAAAGIPERTGWQVSKAPAASLIDSNSAGKPYIISRDFRLMTTLE